MKVYIVTHTSTNLDEWADTEVVSAHLNREKAEKSLADKKSELLKDKYKDYNPDDDESDIDIETDLGGWFKISNNETFDFDELLIHEENVID